MTKESKILKAIIEECQQHSRRMNYAYAQISSMLPLNAEKVSGLTNDEISYCDQYIFRFSKLQDAIGQKLFKLVLELLGEVVYNKSFIDIFNRLEQLGIVEDYNNWQELRIIRNEVAHEYKDSNEEQAKKLNQIIKSKEAMEKYLNDILAYIKVKRLR